MKKLFILFFVIGLFLILTPDDIYAQHNDPERGRSKNARREMNIEGRKDKRSKKRNARIERKDQKRNRDNVKNQKRNYNREKRNANKYERNVKREERTGNNGIPYKNEEKLIFNPFLAKEY